MPMTEVQSSLDGLMLELFGVTKRHDLKREGQKALRGYARVSLSSDVSDGVNQVGTEREGPTERFSDASDGSFLSSREKEKKPGREEASTHKEALKEASVPSDHDPWVATAISINSHLFDVESADRSTRESWRIGLRSNPHPAAKAAMLKLGEE